MTARLLIEAPPTLDEAARWTTPAERLAAGAFGSERRRAEYLGWRAIVRRELGEGVAISYNEVGAPVVEGVACCISVAHCAGRIAVCISPRRCAVDIEPVNRNFARVLERCMTPSERALCEDPRWPGILWCAKEALYKFAGREGLDFLTQLRIETADLAAGRLVGRIDGGEPVELRVRLEEGFITVYML